MTQFEKETLKLISHYKKVLGLDKHEVELKYDKTNEYPMEVKTRYPYLSATICYNDRAVYYWESKTKLTSVNCLEWEYLIIHELCHILTAPLEKKATRRSVSELEVEDANETVVDTITMILLNLIKK